MWTSRISVRFALACALLSSGCECDRAASTGEGESASPEPTGAASGTTEAESSEVPTARREPGPLGRTIAAFDDATVTTRLLVLHRTGAAEGEAAADATVVGAAWVGGVEVTFTIVSETAGGGRSATLFGPVGACQARILRALSLRGDPEGGSGSLYDALEVAPCEGTSVESIETTHPFGVEGDVVVEELSSRSMSAPAEDVAAAVADAEREAGDGEEMDLQARAIGETRVSVVSGWSTHVVRGGALVESFEGGIPAYVTVGDRTLLVARIGRDVRLLAITDAALERVAIETAE